MRIYFYFRHNMVPADFPSDGLGPPLHQFSIAPDSGPAQPDTPAGPPAVVLCQGLHVQVCVRPVAKLDHLHTPGEGSHQAAGGPGGEGHVGHLQHSAPGTRGGFKI